MNIVILEDNANDLKNIFSILCEWEAKSCIPLSIRTYSSIDSFLHHFTILWADVCLLDIQISNTHTNNKAMPVLEKNGVDVAKKLRALGYNKSIIFLSSHREYVFEGYKVHAIDYLLKPVTLKAIAPCLLEIQKKLQNHSYFFQTSTGIYQISYDEIIFFECTLHTIHLITSQRSYAQRATLEVIQSQLPSQFARCHRSYIVNLSHVIRLTRTEILLSNDTRIDVGRSYYQETSRKFIDYTQHLI